MDDPQQCEAPRVRTGEVAFAGHSTWFRVTGDLPGGRADRADGGPTELAAPTPVVVLHGGPGLAHNGYLPMAGLAASGRAVVHYDQLGCGNSTHLPDADPSFWTIDLFKDELATLLTELGIERYHLVGHSWGGMLGAEFAVDRPPGLASLTICNSPASMALWIEAAHQLLAELPQQVAETLLRHEEAGTTDSAEYRDATAFVYSRHFCRVLPLPADVAASLAQADEDPTVYHAMNGPSEFHVIGSLADWSVVERLDAVEVPTLVIGGEHDQATPETWAPYVERIPDARAHVFADASHTPHVEQTDQWLRVVGDFIGDHDAPPTSARDRHQRKASL
ncbi:proline iminopeptidase-family hydrolase [Nocardioides sp. LHG3406-4]|uniref:proline iminopeptidase-family hydrolase n=1 Tax=Nocardioides sp. LHG3406-4 TaxID=2804575 RepID=UPI003CECA99A